MSGFDRILQRLEARSRLVALKSATGRLFPASDVNSSFDLQHMFEAAVQDRYVWRTQATPFRSRVAA
jgi:hypothetical protein